MTSRLTYKKRLNRLKRLPFLISLLAILAIIYDFGFDQSDKIESALVNLYYLSLLTGSLSVLGRYLFSRTRPRLKLIPFDAILFLFLAGLIGQFFGWVNLPFFYHKVWVYMAVGAVFLREFSALRLDFKKQNLNPAQLFMISFLALILAGAFLLLLPNASYGRIGFLDALFTSTSAVCVTGLVVVDTGSFFTLFGQSIILILIQAGGIGIMTFTSYFSYFFRGESSYENNLILSDLMRTERMADVFATLRKILLVTFIVEAIGAVIIYSTLDPSLLSSVRNRIFFSVFHSVSGFCNAGFSTLSNSLYDEGFRFNYPLQMSIATLFILGGLGFPIVFNFVKYIKHLIVNRLHLFRWRKRAVHHAWVININTRIVLVTTGILLLGGTLLFYLLEYHNTLAEHHGIGKIITAFFGAATPRTAGFNSVDTTALNFSTVLIILFLMWVGASPGSTGGGVKTSTLAISILNIFSLARGKDRIELFRREISVISIRRASALVVLSILVVGLSVFLVNAFDPDNKLKDILFECLSAFSTVGLSQGITAGLTDASKGVLILTMFIGRVGTLTMLTAFLHKIKHLNYRYPTEEILIN
ncbi:MAG: ATPase [Porphyromonadaceae bacterium]|nr:MAG: ATPase [Porphyromonadaceae bacterium]